MSAEIRDLYGQLIDGMQGVRGQIRSGGDEGAQLQASPPTGPPVAFWSGLVTVGADGTAEVTFDVPAFSGTLRVMAVAWSKDKVGHATTDVTVRDPVVLTATLPRFLLPGDKSSLHLELDNVEGAAGDYRIAVSSADALAASATQKLTLRAKERGALNVPLGATAAGNGSVRINVSGPSGFALERSFNAHGASPAQIWRAAPCKPMAKGKASRCRATCSPISCPAPVRVGLGRRVHGARCRRVAGGARPLSVALLGADHQPRAAAALCQRAGERGADCGRYRYG